MHIALDQSVVVCDKVQKPIEIVDKSSRRHFAGRTLTQIIAFVFLRRLYRWLTALLYCIVGGTPGVYMAFRAEI